MKVSQKIGKYIYSRLPARSAEVMSTRHIHWVFKHRNIRHTNVTLQMKKILLIKKYPKAFHIVRRTHCGGKPQQKFKELLSRGKKLTVARKKSYLSYRNRNRKDQVSLFIYHPIQTAHFGVPSVMSSSSVSASHCRALRPQSQSSRDKRDPNFL